MVKGIIANVTRRGNNILFEIFFLIKNHRMIIKKKSFTDLGIAVRKIGQRIWQGLGAVRHLKKRGQFLLLTLLLWILYRIGLGLRAVDAAVTKLSEILHQGKTHADN